MQKDIKQLRNRLFLLITGVVFAVTLYGTTAAKGVFTVAADKTVQFANAPEATRVATHNLYQWNEVAGLVSAAGSGWSVLTSAEWSYLLAEGGYTSGSSAHYNFFMGANNTLYWPDDATYGAEAKMKGFRAYFSITPGGGPSPVSRYRNMPAVWSICAEPNSPTSTDNVQGNNVQGNNVQCTKVMRDGQIYLIHKGIMYNIQGQRIEYK